LRHRASSTLLSVAFCSGRLQGPQVRLLLRKNPFFAAFPHREPLLREPVGATSLLHGCEETPGLGRSSRDNYIVGRHESSVVRRRPLSHAAKRSVRGEKKMLKGSTDGSFSQHGGLQFWLIKVMTQQSLGQSESGGAGITICIGAWHVRPMEWGVI
jgi:hypothetical protein